MGVPNSDPFSEDYDPSVSQEPVVTGMCELCHNFIWGKHMDGVLNALDGRKTLVITIHGSHLYGLDHPESDLDIKGVFIPTTREVFLNKVPRVIKYNSGNDGMKNSKDDVDVEFYSLHHFFKLLAEGDTGAISMLYAPFSQTCSQHELWETVLENKHLFLSKEMAGLIGFVRTQVNKYCEKSGRLNAATDVLNFLEASGTDLKIKEYWELLPTGKFLKHVERNGNFYYKVCGRMIQDTSSKKYAIGVIKSIIESYGNRTRSASNSGGHDWKSISHGLRIIDELKDLYSLGKIVYPLKNMDYIMDVKLGNRDFETEVLPALDKGFDDIHKLSKCSNFQDTIDVGLIDSFLISLIRRCISDQSK